MGATSSSEMSEKIDKEEFEIDWQDDPRYLPSLNRHIDQFESGLYIGSLLARSSVNELGIDTIVSVLTDKDRLLLYKYSRV